MASPTTDKSPGFIQGGRDFTAGCASLKKLDEELTRARQVLNLDGDGSDVLPVGVGFVAYAASIKEFAKTTTPILQNHRPAAVWLFAPSPEAPNTVADVIKSVGPAGREWGLKVVVQVGSVAAARKAAQDGADIIVAQGIDAGGHQWSKGAGIISLVPEIADLLREEFADREIGLWAAGGIADGRGIAAALALGAEGAVLGTRVGLGPYACAPIRQLMRYYSTWSRQSRWRKTTSAKLFFQPQMVELTL